MDKQTGLQGLQVDHENRYTSYTDEKTIIKTLSKKKNGSSNTQIQTSQTSLHKLNRPEQIILFRSENWAQPDLMPTCTASSRLVSLRCAHATQTS